MLIQPIPISPTFTSFTPTFIGSPTALIAIARTSRDGDGYRYRHRYGDGDRDRYWDRYWDRYGDRYGNGDGNGDVVIPPPISLPRLLAFEDGMEVDDGMEIDDAGDGDGDDDGDVDVVLDADADSDSESTISSTTSTSSASTTSTTSHISDISSMTSVSSSSSISKSSPAAAGVVYVPPHKLSTTKSESEFDSGGSIPSHRLLSYSRSQHSSKFYPIPIPKSQSKSTSQSQSKSSVSVCRYKYQGGETGVMTGGVMLGSAIRSPLARPTKRGTTRTLILGPDSSSSLDWRRPRVPGLLA